MSSIPKCPKCNAPMENLARGKELRLWSCTSDQCAKEPFNFSAYYQPNSKLPVVWALEIGKMYQLSFEKAESTEKE